MSCRKLSVFAICVCFCLSLCLCSCAQINTGPVVTNDIVTDEPPKKQPYPVSFDDEVFDSAPKLVASLSPAITDILFDLGAQDRLIAVSDYCTSHSGDISRIGSPAFPEIEKIIALSPELLLTQSPLASTDVIKLKQAGIRTLCIDSPRSFAALCEEYIRLSLIFYGAVDSQNIAIGALNELDAAMLKAQQIGADLSFACITEEIGGNYIVSTENTLHHDILSVFGTNAFAERESSLVSSDELSQASLQAVFVSDKLDSDSLSEVFDDDTMVIEVDMTSFERPTQSIYQIVRYITERLMGQ